MQREQGLTIDKLNAFYGKAQVLRNVSLSVQPGERVAILGRNGMGKTTLLKSILNIDHVRVNGSIQYEGVELVGKPTSTIAKSGISYIPQGWQLFRSLSVEEHLIMPYRKSADSYEWTPERVLEAFPEIARRRKVGGTRLSGGEQQILAIGRALVTNARMILMDEPSEGVSTMVLERVREICEELAHHGRGILLVEQNLSLALKIAERVLILVNGEIVYEAAASDFAHDRERQAQYLGV